MIDTSKYLDIPFVYGGRDWSGVDCWGMCKIVAWHEFGLELPDYPHAGMQQGVMDYRRLARETADHRRHWARMDEPKPGDVVLLTPRTLPIHVGMVITGRPYQMIHTQASVGVCIERVYSIRWRDRVEGFYRYV